jgi:hypothetical protein
MEIPVITKDSPMKVFKLQTCSPKNIPVIVVNSSVSELVIGTTSDKFAYPKAI